jgi:murein L,D-transpeptidase YcbB/YkuD
MAMDSGGGNALGGIKFLFPNKESVYMHDTPTKPLFQRDTRAFSHGCIRIEKPVAMAEYLLKDETEWTTEKIVAASKLGRERTVTLKEKIPVHIIYLTAWADESGKAQFRRDVYHYDKALQKIFCKK